MRTIPSIPSAAGASDHLGDHRIARLGGADDRFDLTTLGSRTIALATRELPGQVGDWTIEFVGNQSWVSLPPA